MLKQKDVRRLKISEMKFMKCIVMYHSLDHRKNEDAGADQKVTFMNVF
jgi:hypothetical protein